MTKARAPRVSNDTSRHQFEIFTELGTSVLTYAWKGDVLDLVHTEVPPALEGKGFGKALAEAALSYARAERKKVMPSCPFVKHYVESHPEYASLIASDAGKP